MSTQITSSILRGCKSIGGISKVYLFPFENYSRSQIVYSGLTLTSFPATTLYEFQPDNKPNFENKSEEDDGGKYYTENIDLQFVGIYLYDEFEKLLEKDIRCIILDNKGNYRLLGAFNGLQVKRLQVTTGGAKSDFRGYQFNIEGKEERQSLFISDLASAGFTIDTLDFLQTETGEYLLTENNKLIKIE